MSASPARTKKVRTPRLIVAPNFGRQLRRMRGTTSRAAICRALWTYGLTVDRSTLLQYERGVVASPDPAIIWALGRIYQQDGCDELLTVLVMDRTGRRLRAGVDLALPRLSMKQVQIAEWFGQLDPEIQTVVMTLMEALSPKLSPNGARHARGA